MTRKKKWSIWLLGMAAVVLLCAYPTLEEKYGFRIRKHLHGDGSSYPTDFLIGSTSFLIYDHKALECLILNTRDLFKREDHLDDLKSGKVALTEAELRGELPPSVCTIERESDALEEGLKEYSSEYFDAQAFRDGWLDKKREIHTERAKEQGKKTPESH
jgi:hypothetical protein